MYLVVGCHNTLNDTDIRDKHGESEMNIRRIARIVLGLTRVRLDSVSNPWKTSTTLWNVARYLDSDLQFHTRICFSSSNGYRVCLDIPGLVRSAALRLGDGNPRSTKASIAARFTNMTLTRPTGGPDLSDSRTLRNLSGQIVSMILSESTLW